MRLDLLLPNDSKIRQLLVERMSKGLETTVVVYHPDATAELKAFIKAVLTWQVNRKDTERGLTSPTRVIEDTEIDDLFKRYVDDLKLLNNRRRLETTDTKFQEFKLRHTIPMLMYAAELPGGGSRGLVYLGETDALAKGAKTGGFISEDSRIVNVLKEQIWMEELPVPSAVPTSDS